MPWAASLTSNATSAVSSPVPMYSACATMRASVAPRGEHAVAGAVVHVGSVMGGHAQVRAGAEEAEHSRVEREVLEELAQRFLVIRADRANVDRGAVAEGDVHLPLARVAGVC